MENDILEFIILNRDLNRIGDLDPALVDHSSTEIQDLSGEYTSEYIYPVNAAGYDLLNEGNFFAYRDLNGDYQLFEMVNIVKTLDSEGRKAVRVYGEHAYYELATDRLLNYSLTGVSAGFAVFQVTGETNWEAGEIADLGSATVHFLDDNPLEALIKIAEIWEGELRFRSVLSHTGVETLLVDLLERRGAFRGKRFELGYDVSNISISTDTRNLRTALYGRGQGEFTADFENENEEEVDEIVRIDFSDIEWVEGQPTPAVGDPEGGPYTGPPAPVDKPMGQHWIGDEEARQLYGKTDLEDGRKHIFGLYESQAEHPENLIWETWRQLTRVRQPDVNVESRVANLEKVPGFEHEKIRVGDDVYLVVPGIIKPVSARVLRIERRRKDPGNTVLELGNYRPVNSRDLMKELLENRRRFEARQGIFERSEFFEKVDAEAEVGEDYVYALNIGERSIRVIGDTEFYWDGSGLYAVNPEDYLNYWRFDKEGLRLTKDGGSSFIHNLGLDIVEIGTDAIFAGRLEAVEGSFIDLFAGTEDAARLELGEEAGEPFFKMFDGNDDLRINIGKEEIEFWRRDQENDEVIKVGVMRAEYIDEYWIGEILGNCLYIEAEGRAIAFNAEVDDPHGAALIVYPRFIWSNLVHAEGMIMGKTSPPDWSFDTEDQDMILNIGHVTAHIMGAELRFWANVTVSGDFEVDGAKNAVVKTDGYGYRKMAALETPDIRFMTIIEQELEDGVFWVEIEPMFAETINGYMVLPFVTGNGVIEVLQKQSNKFQVKYEGKKGVVSFMIYGKRKGYEDIYMKEAQDREERRKKRETGNSER